MNYTKRQKDLIVKCIRLAIHLEVESPDDFYRLIGGNAPTYQELQNLQAKAISNKKQNREKQS